MAGLMHNSPEYNQYNKYKLKKYFNPRKDCQEHLRCGALAILRILTRPITFLEKQKMKSNVHLSHKLFGKYLKCYIMWYIFTSYLGIMTVVAGIFILCFYNGLR